MMDRLQRAQGYCHPLLSHGLGDAPVDVSAGLCVNRLALQSPSEMKESMPVPVNPFVQPMKYRKASTDVLMDQ